MDIRLREIREIFLEVLMTSFCFAKAKNSRVKQIFRLPLGRRNTVCVGVELFSRAASHQVSSPQQSLTSVFGMGTGGPSASETPTLCSRCAIFPGSFPPSIVATAELNFRVRNGNGWTLCVNNTNSWCTFRDSNPGPTD